MKEHMDDYYFYAYYILFKRNNRTWDPHLCHWSKFDIILDAFVYGPHDDLLTWMYKHCHDPLIMYLLDEKLYYVVMYFNILYFVLMMFGRVQYKQWDPGIVWFQFWGEQAVGDIESPLEKVIVVRVEQEQAWWFLFESWKFKFGNSIPTSNNYTEGKRVESSEKVFKIWR